MMPASTASDVIKNALFVVLIICIPILSAFAIRLFLKLARSFEQLNKTLDDARPQINMLLNSLNNTVEDMNSELGKVIELTGEVQEMVERLDGSLQSIDNAMRSPAVRYGSMAAGVITTSALMRSRRKRGKKRKKE